MRSIELRNCILNLEDNRITSCGILHFVKPHWPHLKIIDLSNNDLGVKGAKYLSGGRWPELD